MTLFKLIASSPEEKVADISEQCSRRAFRRSSVLIETHNLDFIDNVCINTRSLMQYKLMKYWYFYVLKEITSSL